VDPDWVTHQIAAAADAAGVEFDIKGGRYYTASQLLASGFDLRNTQRTIRKWIWHRAETRIAAADAYRIQRQIRAATCGLRWTTADAAGLGIPLPR